MNECAAVELSDTSLMLNMRSFRGNNRRAVSISRDGGLTWNTPVDDRTLIEPVCQASFIRYTGRDSPGKNCLLFSNPASTERRRRMMVRLSCDEGRTWPQGKVLYEGSAAYSCLSNLPGDKIGLIYERDDYQKITFARFTLRWLTDSHDF